MAKGNSSKEIIFKKILETFEGSFMADAKTLRIPLIEDGEPIEIKVALTAAKDILGEAVSVEKEENVPEEGLPWTVEPTEEEINNVKTLMSNLF